MPIEMIKFKFLKLSSYIPLLFLVALGFSLLFFRVFPVRIFHNPTIAVGLGIFFFIIGTTLAVLSELTRHRMFSIMSDALTCEDFESGIYKYSRHAGTFGFLLLFFGFGFVLNSIAVIIVVFLHFVLLSLVFIPIIEHEMKKVCGDSYRKYCENVRMWI